MSGLAALLAGRKDPGIFDGTARSTWTPSATPWSTPAGTSATSTAGTRRRPDEFLAGIAEALVCPRTREEFDALADGLAEWSAATATARSCSGTAAVRSAGHDDRRSRSR